MARARIAELELARDRLAVERVSLQIFVEEDPAAYRQMFVDINDNALGVSNSVKARFDSRKVVNRSLDFVSDHPLLEGRVDPERDRIGRGSPFLVGAKHVAEIVRTVNVGLEGRVSRRQELEFNEKAIAETARRFLNVLVDGFPPLRDVAAGQLTPDGLRKSSLLGSVLMLRVLGGVYHDLVKTEREWTDQRVTEFFAILAPHLVAPVTAQSMWMTQTDVFAEGTLAPRGRRQDSKALNDALVEWALLRPAFLFDSVSESVV